MSHVTYDTGTRFFARFRLFELSDKLFQLIRICTRHLLDFRAALHEVECGHGSDSARRCHFLIRVHVHLDEDALRVLCCEVSKKRCDELTWPTPRGSEVNDD